MYLLGVKNFGTQSVTSGEIINIGDVYRRFCRKNSCGTKVFDTTSTGIALQWDGFYHVTAVLVGTGADAGDVSVQLFENGVPISDAVSTQTVTTADTEVRTFVIDYFVAVDKACVLGTWSTVAKVITLENVGVDATFTSVTINIEKEA